MIATSSKKVNENNHKTKKRTQILISRDQSLQNWNSCDKNTESDAYIETDVIPLQVDADDVGHNKTSLINDETNKNKQNVSEKIGSPKTKANDMSEENYIEKSRFEEIEGKLEEMFAGIEGEQVINTTNQPRKMNDSSDKYVQLNSNLSKPDNNNHLPIDNCIKYSSCTLSKSPLLKKTAEKSTSSLYNTEKAKQLNLFRDYKNHLIPKSMLYLKTMPPRRLSIGINKELLKYSLKTNDEVNEKKTNVDLIGMVPLPLNLETHKDVKQIRKNVPKNKINNNQKKSSKYKKEITYITSNICSNKKISHNKSDASNKSKQNRQKIKQNQMQQRLLSSENDFEEKQSQTRDVETKNRSPFILLKNNGTVAVVNTVIPDDSNEKHTRSKKPNNYAYERKVKGCYSSTLSNRYDADTADSSWKCVFCKLGPHKKGLGDLFGPYIISNDCDEYRSTKDSFENFQKLRRNDVQHMKFSDKTIAFINGTSNINIQNISECRSDGEANATGMTQISVDCYEIWVHEECVIWAPNIFVVGSRLAGLEEATWNSTRYKCGYCLKQGALLCCLQRDCKSISHIPCARELGWLLDESNFWVYCSKHALNQIQNKK